MRSWKWVVVVAGNGGGYVFWSTFI